VIDAAAWIVLLLQVFCVDLLLGADNVVVIALACSRLPAEETRRAVTLGAVGAIALRLGMLAFANVLLDVPLVKLIAAWTLIVIALNVRAREADEKGITGAGAGAAAGDFVAAAAIITLADAAMSLDNVVALAAIARGNFLLLALGVALSIPIIAYGSLILTGLIRRAPMILTLGAVVLGWIAGEMVVSDPLLSGWVQSNAPALVPFAPALGAAFVWVAGAGAARRAPRRAIEPKRAIWTPPLAARGGEAAPRGSTDARPARGPVAMRAPSQISIPAARFELRPAPAPSRWSEERVMVLGFVILAALAGLIIVVASFLDSLT
jgi:YjbE family integral membrane protein